MPLGPGQIQALRRFQALAAAPPLERRSASLDASIFTNCGGKSGATIHCASRSGKLSGMLCAPSANTSGARHPWADLVKALVRPLPMNRLGSHHLSAPLRKNNSVVPTDRPGCRPSRSGSLGHAPNEDGGRTDFLCSVRNLMVSRPGENRTHPTSRSAAWSCQTCVPSSRRVSWDGTVPELQLRTVRTHDPHDPGQCNQMPTRHRPVSLKA